MTLRERLESSLDALVARFASADARAPSSSPADASPQPPPLPADSPLYGLDNVILTPHIGWQRLETRQRIVEMVAENIEAFVRGERLNVVS